MPKIKVGRKLAVTLVVLSCVVILGANVRFVYLASKTQPDCVAHKKTGTDATQGYAAAKSSC